MTIPVLIDKLDNAELIRNQIAAILKAEAISQRALAVTAGKADPDEWNFRVFVERANPWEEWRDKTTAQLPIINVWWDSSTFDQSASNVVSRQKATGTFNIDCYGHGIAANAAGADHVPGDRQAALVAQRAVRLVRNILMASENTYLQMQGVVWKRFPQAINLFQPQQDDQNVVQCLGARLALMVEFNEFAPEGPEEVLEYLAIDAYHTPDGELLFEVDIDYTA